MRERGKSNVVVITLRAIPMLMLVVGLAPTATRVVVVVVVVVTTIATAIHMAEAVKWHPFFYEMSLAEGECSLT